MKPSFNPKKITAILFDFGGTLDADGTAWKERFYPIYKKFGVRWPFPVFEKRFFASDDFITDQKFTDIPMFDTLKLQVALVLREGGIHNEKLAGRIARAFMDDSMKSVHKKIPLLKRLRKKYRLAVVANFYGNLSHFARETGLEPHVDALVDSALVGVIKPDPRIFRAALKQVNASPAQALFVGDSMKRDMAGARALGMPHMWVRGAHGNLQKTCCPDDLSVRTILELEDLLL